jgi:uncharacterized protein (DUF1330 family)
MTRQSGTSARLLAKSDERSFCQTREENVSAVAGSFDVAAWLAYRLRGSCSRLAAQNQQGGASMKTHYTVALAMAAGFGLGAVAVQGLHAQGKAPVYYVAEIDVTNPDAYAKEYAPKAQALIKAAGGRILAVGGAAGGAKVTGFDGEPPKRAVVQVWDSMDKIQAWRDNPEYKELRKVGEKYAKFRAYTIEGLPQ